MIIDKVKPFYTDQGRDELKALKRKAAAVDREMLKALKADDMEKADRLLNDLSAINQKMSAIRTAAEGRYIASLGGDVEKILLDCADIARAVTRKDYDNHRRRGLDLENDARRNGTAPGDGIRVLLGIYDDSAEGAARYIFQLFKVQIVALDSVDGVGGKTKEEAAARYEANREHTERARAIADARARELYPDIILMTGAPVRHIEPNHPIVNHMQSQGWTNNQEFDIKWTNKPGPGKNRALIVNRKEKELSIARHMTEDQRQIYAAVTSWVIEAKERGLSPVPCDIDLNMIYAAMPGGGSVLSDARAEEIQKSMDLFRHTDAVADMTEEWRAKGLIGKDETHIRRAALLQGDWDTRLKGGKRVDVFHLLDIPFLYQLSLQSEATGKDKGKNNIISYPAYLTAIHEIERDAAGKVVQLPAVMSTTSNRSSIIAYLLRRIYIMEHDRKEAREKLKGYDKRRKKAITAGKDLGQYPEKTLDDFRKQNDVILFDSVFKDAGIVPQSAKEASRYKNFVRLVLDNQIAYRTIKSWTDHPNKIRPTGVKIELK